MTLDEYLKQAPRGEAARLARALGCAISRITEYRYGRKSPRPSRAAEISRLTCGRVSIAELCPREDWKGVKCALR